MQFWKWNCVWNISSTQQKRCSHISVHRHIKQNWPVHESHHVIMNTRKSEIVQIFTLPTLSKGESLVKSGNKSMKGKSPNLHPVHQKRRSLDPFSWAADIIKKMQDRGPRIPANYMFSYLKQLSRRSWRRTKDFCKFSLHIVRIIGHHKQLCKRPEMSWRGWAPVVCRNS